MSLITPAGYASHSLDVFRSCSPSGSASADSVDHDKTILGFFRSGNDRNTAKQGLKSYLVDRSSRQVLYDFVLRHQAFAESSLVLSKVVNKAQKLDRKEAGSVAVPLRHAFHVVPPLLWKTQRAFEKCLQAPPDDGLLNDETVNLTILLSQMHTIDEPAVESRVYDQPRHRTADAEFGKIQDDLRELKRESVSALFKNYIDHDLIKPGNATSPRSLEQLARYLLLLQTDHKDCVSEQFRFINALEGELLRAIAAKYPKLVIDELYKLSIPIRDRDDSFNSLVTFVGVKELFIALFETLSYFDPFRPLQIFSQVDSGYKDVFKNHPELFFVILPQLQKLSTMEGGKQALRVFFNRLECNGDCPLLDGEVTRMELLSLFCHKCGMDYLPMVSRNHGLTESESLSVLKTSMDHLITEGNPCRLDDYYAPYTFDDPAIQQEWDSFLRDKVAAFMQPRGRHVLISGTGSEEEIARVDAIPYRNLFSVFRFLYRNQLNHPNEAFAVRLRKLDPGNFAIEMEYINQRSIQDF